MENQLYSLFREVRQNQGREVRVKVVRNWTEDDPVKAEVVVVKLVSSANVLLWKFLILYSL